MNSPMTMNTEAAYIHRVRGNKGPTVFVNNCNKFKRIFTIFGTH